MDLKYRGETIERQQFVLVLTGGWRLKETALRLYPCEASSATAVTLAGLALLTTIGLMYVRRYRWAATTQSRPARLAS